MSALTMVIETVDAETGDILSVGDTERHGWNTPAEAVKHWRTRAPVEPYLNGRVTHRPEIGVDTRVYFRSEPEALFEVAEVHA